MSFGDRWREVRTGFERSFWIANFTELFERLAYYGLQAVPAIYLHERLGLGEGRRLHPGSLRLRGLVPADPGRRDREPVRFSAHVAAAYGILAAGYFLFASIGGEWLAPVRAALPLYWVAW